MAIKRNVFGQRYDDADGPCFCTVGNGNYYNRADGKWYDQTKLDAELSDKGLSFASGEAGSANPEWITRANLGRFGWTPQPTLSVVVDDAADPSVTLTWDAGVEATVEWGDGDSEVATASATHGYLSNGVKNLKVTAIGYQVWTGTVTIAGAP